MNNLFLTILKPGQFFSKKGVIILKENYVEIRTSRKIFVFFGKKNLEDELFATLPLEEINEITFREFNSLIGGFKSTLIQFHLNGDFLDQIFYNYFIKNDINRFRIFTFLNLILFIIPSQIKNNSVFLDYIRKKIKFLEYKQNYFIMKITGNKNKLSFIVADNLEFVENFISAIDKEKKILNQIAK